MTTGFVHPLSGELLAADADALAQADRETRDEIGRLWRALRPITEALADQAGPVVVPRRRDRTDVQEKAVRCPRCGGHYTEASAA